MADETPTNKADEKGEPLEPSPDKSGDRDALGRFVKGHNSRGPGRPKGSRDHLLKSLESAATQDALRKVSKTLVRKAERGDLRAIEILTNRLFGKAAQNLHVTTDPASEGYDEDEKFL